MAARRDRSHLTVSLFPFLSVLACVTGTLSFMISGMSAVALGDTEQLIQLTASGSKKTPRYVECREDGLLIHPQGTAVSIDELQTPANAYFALLAEITAHTESQCLILLVRPDGVLTYERAWQIARAFGRQRKRPFDLGSDAVYAAGPIRFREASEPLPPETPK